MINHLWLKEISQTLRVWCRQNFQFCGRGNKVSSCIRNIWFPNAQIEAF